MTAIPADLPEALSRGGAPSAGVKPVFVHTYPPLALAAGMPFLVWLFGSLTWDSVFGAAPDGLLAILFGLLALASMLFVLIAWLDILFIRRIGLRLDADGLRHITAGFRGLSTRFVDWAKVSKISLDKENLILHTGGDAISVDLGGLLEDPVWILDRALAWRSSRTGEGDRLQATAQIEKLQAELADVSCTACGGRLPVELGQERLVCGFCGGTNVLKEEVKNSLRRVGEVVRNLPAAHRQVHKQSLRRYMTEGAGIRRRMVWAGGLTAAVMILFAIIDGISTSLNQSGFAMNLRFTVGMSVLAALSLATGLLLSYATRRVALSYALPMQAIPPLDPGGAARCRLCGADLPEKGILRRCEYCGTDSIVTGARLARVERTAHQALEQARAAVEQSTEGAARVLDKVAGNLAAFANLQFFWLHIPILVALDGYHGPLRITGICVAVILASLIAGFVGIRWLQREQQAALE